MEKLTLEALYEVLELLAERQGLTLNRFGGTIEVYDDRGVLARIYINQED